MGRRSLSPADLRYVEHVKRVAVITGASSGIGEATARALAARGWHCVLLARREQLLLGLADEIGAEAEPCDVGDRAAVEAAAARILSRHPSVQVLVNNAGMPARRPFADVDLDLVEEVARVNYLGGVWLTRTLLPGLRPAPGGAEAHIVNVVSVAGTVAFAPSGAYTAAKHAQLTFSRSLQASLRGSGIAVHSILPGYVETEGFPQRALLEHRLLRHIVVRPERVAATIAQAVEGRGREVVVPWFPYRPATLLFGIAPGLVSRLGGRAVARSSAFRAKAADAPPEST
jgi:short-subunit dehydrogenase